MASISSSIMICSPLIFPHYKDIYIFLLTSFILTPTDHTQSYIPHPQLHTTPTATDHTHSYIPHPQLHTTPTATYTIPTATDHTHSYRLHSQLQTTPTDTYHTHSYRPHPQLHTIPLKFLTIIQPLGKFKTELRHHLHSVE